MEVYFKILPKSYSIEMRHFIETLLIPDLETFRQLSTIDTSLE